MSPPICVLVSTSSVVPNEDSGYKPGRIPVDRSLLEVLEARNRFPSDTGDEKVACSCGSCWLEMAGDFMTFLKLKTPKNGHEKMLESI